MELDDIRQLYDYTRWADRRILAAAGKLAAADFTRPAGNSFPSVRDTLAHLLGAEWVWLERWLGRHPTAMPDPAGFPSLQSLESHWDTVEADRARFLGALTSERLREPFPYINLSGKRYAYPLWQQMVHVVNHSTYHRGQVITLVRQFGADAVTTDFLVYYDEMPATA